MPTSIPQKHCSKCAQIKPLDAFAKAHWTKDGVYPSCKACKNAQSAEHRAAHREEHRARSLEYHHTHKEQRSATGKAYYAANREKVLARTARYYQEHPEISRKSAANYRKKNRDRLLPDLQRRSAEWREANRDKDRAASKRWRNENRSAFRAIQHRRKARVKGNGGSYTAQQWDALKAQHDHRCLCCGKQEPEIALTVDHIVPIACGGSNDITNLQPLCLSCNCSKQDRATDYR